MEVANEWQCPRPYDYQLIPSDSNVTRMTYLWACLFADVHS
jgi:hypothetical protein